LAINEGAEFYAFVYLEKEPYPEIEIQLFADKAPSTVNNFIKLVREGFYDGLTFHHVVPGELVQTGDPTGTGDGGPGYAIEDEFHPDLRHDSAGIVAMSNSSSLPGESNGSQFYITLAPLPDRDGTNPDGSPKDCESDDVACHSVFGRVTKGMHLVNAFTDDPHLNAIREGDIIRKIEIVTQYAADSTSASKPPNCSNGIAVARPEQTPGLVRHCEILLAIKESLAGEAKLNWSDQTPIWEWHGITIVNSSVPLINLDLHRRGLTGFIPEDLSDLTGLRNLVLSFNQLTGTIPPELGNLRDLEVLGLYQNRLTGGIPTEIGQLARLKVLDIGENRLRGGIPNELSNLTQLEEIWLNESQLTGEFPDFLADLTNLRRLNIGRNFLTGTIPATLGKDQQFDDLQLFPNNLEGCIPDQLNRFDLHNVQLRFCSAPPAWRIPVTMFDGGVDLSVTYIERLPRYPSYQVVYYESQLHCPYLFDESLGPALCNDDSDIKRNPQPGDSVQLIAHVRNFGDTDVGQFDYVWRIEDQVLESGVHEGIASPGHAEFTFNYVWPDQGSNPIVTFEVDTENQIDEIFEVNNEVHDWIKGHTIGIYFSEEAYESLRLSAEVDGEFQSPEHWFRENLDRLNELLIEADVEDRVRTELFYVSSERTLDFAERTTHFKHDLKWVMDGWWGIWHEYPYENVTQWSHFNFENFAERPVIDFAMIHEILHQLGVIDIYQMHLNTDQVRLPDANQRSVPAGCGLRYWNSITICFRFPEHIEDVMSTWKLYTGPHTAGALRSNTGYRRGFYGEYLFDTPENTSIKIVDNNRNPLENVELRFYQLEVKAVGDEHHPIVDDVVEFTVTTNKEGIAELPNRGHTGILTATEHQLRPNPFGVISVVGNNGIFIIEMESDQCTNYEWLTLVELNLAYWDGQTDNAEFTKTLRCPPPR